MKRWFKQRNYQVTKCESGAVRVTELLQATLHSEQGRWVLQSRDSAANELAIEYATEGEASQKIIDRTFIEGGTRWIIDYKSVLISDNISDAGLYTIAEQHREQLENYAQLFEDESLPLKIAVFFVSIGRLVTLAR